ncbi:MAG TPA: glycosyltransferase, partial [Saprospiraceae bacterium]|nr:glycosyltransferase [Saprospiraceae bacterium]
MKKVLIIAYYWPPAGGGGVQRWVKFVKYLRDFGWEPIVYVPQNPDYPYYDQELCNDIPQGIEVLKGPIIEPNQVLNFFKKDAQKHNNYLAQGKKNTFLQKCMVFIRANFFIPDARMLWIKPSVKRLSRYLKENHVDVLISTGPPHSCHLIGLELHKQSKIPWIADFRDAWSQIEHFNEMMLSSRSKAHHLALEKQVLDTASCVTTVGYYLAQDLSKISDNNIHVIRNGFDPSDFKHLESQYDDNRFTISYIGSMLFSQNPDVLWTALTLLYQENFDFASKLQLNMIGTLDKVVQDTI